MKNKWQKPVITKIGIQETKSGKPKSRETGSGHGPVS